MIQLPCPWCGPRNVSEFHHRGELTPRPDPATATPQEWRDYLYVRANTAGWTTESWHHQAGCRRFFTLQRNTLTNETRAAEGAATDGEPEPPMSMAERGGQL